MSNKNSVIKKNLMNENKIKPHCIQTIRTSILLLFQNTFNKTPMSGL